jgi:hypothetical protein
MKRYLRVVGFLGLAALSVIVAMGGAARVARADQRESKDCVEATCPGVVGDEVKRMPASVNETQVEETPTVKADADPKVTTDIPPTAPAVAPETKSESVEVE